MDERLARNLAEHFEEFGLRFQEPVDLAEIPEDDTIRLTLTHELGQAVYNVGYTYKLTVSSLNRARLHRLDNERMLLLGPRVTERSATMFRQLGINYLDQAGNAFICFAGVRIDVRGRRAEASPGVVVPRPERGGVNLFSAKRSQVIFAVLSWPELLTGPIRKIAAISGVSVGQVQKTLELLSQYGFLDERRRLARPQRDHLIDQWAAAFRTGLGSAARTKRFSGDWHELHPGTTAVYVSGEAAVPELLRPETAVLYTASMPTDLIRSYRWRKDETQPNILLRDQFWRPLEATGPGVFEAPWLLIYADLLASNDSRQREAAEQFRQRQP